MDKILLPIDGSDISKESYSYAKDLAKNHNSQVTVLYVKEKKYWPPSYGYGAPFVEGMYLGNKKSAYMDHKNINSMEVKGIKESHGIKSKKIKEKYSKWSEELMVAIEEAEKYFKDLGIKVDTRIVEGYPATEILEISEKENFDLIIMPTHGMSAIKRFTLGSVTNKVVHNSKVPVLVVK